MSCTSFFCKDQTSDTQYLSKNPIQFLPPKLQKLSLKKNHTPQQGTSHSQFTLLNKTSKVSSYHTPQSNLTQRSINFYYDKLLIKSRKDMKNIALNKSPQMTTVFSTQKRQYDFRQKKKLNLKKEDKKAQIGSKNLIAIEFQY